MGEHEAEQLVRDILKVHLVEDEQLVVKILRRSGGNPLYIKEVIDVLSDRGMLKAGGEALPSLGSDADPQWLPASVEGLIGARLDMLDFGPKLALQKVALLWSPFSRHDASLVLEEAELDTLNGLVKVQLLERADGPGRGSLETYEPEAVPQEGRYYRFCNALTQEVASRTLVPDEAAQLHQRIAVFLLARGEKNGHYDSALIARHFDGAGQGETAIRYYVEAAEDAFERFGAGECVRLCQKVLKRSELSAESRLGLLLLEQTALHELGNQERSREILDDLHGLVMAGDDQARQVEVLLRLATHHFNETDFKAARTSVEQALVIAEAAQDGFGRAQAWRIEATIALTEGHRDRALELIAECISIYSDEEHTRAYSGLAAAYNLQGVIFRQSGRHHEALQAYERAMEQARKAQDKKLLRQLMINSGLALVYTGEFNEALERYGSALEECRRLGHRRDEAILLINIGHANL
ncbi:MAG: tetratricopeptide repeat protein, partial [Bradymonadaceae bacterium]